MVKCCRTLNGQIGCAKHQRSRRSNGAADVLCPMISLSTQRSVEANGIYNYYFLEMQQSRFGARACIHAFHSHSREKKACRGILMLFLLPLQLVAYTTMPVDEFHTKLLQGFFGVLIDTRAQSEWDAGHLPNATFLREMHVTGDVSPIAGCKLCNVAVYCHSGFRSKQAADQLEAAGFVSVYDVQGIVQWQGAGHSLVSTASVATACSKATAVCSWPYQSPSPPPAALGSGIGLLASTDAKPPPPPPPPPPAAPPPSGCQRRPS